MIIVRLLSPEPVGWLQHHQLYSGLGADIVPFCAMMSEIDSMGALIAFGLSAWASVLFIRGSVTGAPPLYSTGALQRSLHFSRWNHVRFSGNRNCLNAVRK
jgi:hypothetical protein